jgi:toxin CcdB
VAQYDVYRNSGRDAGDFPYVVDVQYDLLSGCGTRVVVPLLAAKAAQDRKMDLIDRVNPLFTFGDKEVILAAHLLTAISTKDLKEKVGSIASMRSEIIAAIDVVLTGI